MPCGCTLVSHMPLCGQIWTNQKKKAAERFKYIILMLGLYHDSAQDQHCRQSACSCVSLETWHREYPELVAEIHKLCDLLRLLAPSISGVRPKIISTIN